MNSREGCIALNLINGIGFVKYSALVGRFGSPEAVFSASREELLETPGIGEQGGKEADVNFALGTVMADSADAVILVGRRAFSRSIIRGMMQSGFSRTNLHIADDMDDASEILNEISEDGDTVLFESRIPDYEEE